MCWHPYMNSGVCPAKRTQKTSLMLVQRFVPWTAVQFHSKTGGMASLAFIRTFQSLQDASVAARLSSLPYPGLVLQLQAEEAGSSVKLLLFLWTLPGIGPAPPSAWPKAHGTEAELLVALHDFQMGRPGAGRCLVSSQRGHAR